MSTPGPWKFDGNNRILGPETPDDLPVLANVYGAAVEDQEGYANARLIAAAPELLEACKAAAVCLDPDSAKAGIRLTTKQRSEAMNMLFTAIAKATGGAQ